MEIIALNKIILALNNNLICHIAPRWSFSEIHINNAPISIEALLIKEFLKRRYKWYNISINKYKTK